MQYLLSRRLLVFGGISLLAALFSIFLRPAASQGNTPMKDGHPDFTGYWVPGPAGQNFGQAAQQFERDADGSLLFDFSLDQGKEPLCESDDCQAPNQPPYKPDVMPKVREIAKTEFAGTTPLDPITQCKPGGVPRAALGNVQIVQSPQVIAMVHGDYSDRLIYTDGRPHPADLEPSYMGDSIGRWEGNTLVVDVAGLNDDTWLGGSLDGKNIYTSIHSDKEHVVERWTRRGNEITVETTVDDPAMFTKPWVIAPRKIHLAAPDDYLISYFCDGAETTQLNRSHFVKPNPEDRDYKNKCNGHRCGAIVPNANPTAK